MTTNWQDGTTIAQHVRVRGAGLDAITARLRIAYALEAVDLQPRGLPPSAVVCIRRLCDPLPGVLSLQRAGERPPRAWEYAMAGAIAQSVQRAARPLHGAVPASADVVVFNDRAELLACLARDWLEGSVSARWWWRSLFREDSVLAAWLAAPAYAPAALQHLAQSGKAAQFVSSLSTNDALRLLEGICRSFVLNELYTLFVSLPDEASDGTTFQLAENELYTLVASPPDSAYATLDTLDNEAGEDAPCSGVVQPSSVGDETRREQISRGFSQERRVRAALSAPWAAWIDESGDASLPLAQQCLLGIGLMVWRAPVHVRSTTFLRAVRIWLAEQLNERVGHRSILGAGETVDAEWGSLSSPVRPHSHDVRQDSWEQDQASLFSLPYFPTTGFAGVDEQYAAPANSTSTGEANSDQEAGLEDHAGWADKNIDEPVIDETDYAARQFIVPVKEKRAAIPELFEADITTAYGGIFYLLNLAQALDLYNDFTSPAVTGIPLPIWDFLALAGEALIGETLHSDPLWLFLARLAGRSDQEAPGKGFVPPDSWYIPTAWLAVFPGEDTWEWRTDGERVSVWHPAGFMVFDAPLSGEQPLQQVMQAMQSYGDRRLMQSSSNRQLDRAATPLAQWLAWLMPYLRVRLQRALGLANDDDLARTLCAYAARIVATATHLDIFLALNDLPIAIRLTGLDRDPAWIPAAGRFIAFHFD